MSTLDSAMDYLADYHTLKKITSITYPISFGAPSSNYTTFLTSSLDIVKAKRVIVELGGQTPTMYYHITFDNTGKIIEKNHTFLFDTSTTNTLSSSYFHAAGIRINFSTGRVEGRQICKKTNGVQLYVHAIYYQ